MIILLFDTGTPTPPSGAPVRFMSSCWWIVVIVITATYAGNLVAILSVYKPGHAVDTLAVLLQQTDYKIGITKGDTTEQYIKVYIILCYR